MVILRGTLLTAVGIPRVRSSEAQPDKAIKEGRCSETQDHRKLHFALPPTFNISSQIGSRTAGRRQCPANTKVWMGSRSAWMRRIIACTRATVSTTCSATHLTVPMSFDCSSSWLLV